MKIGLDPGHGGFDPGAVDPVQPHEGDRLYTKEADIALAIAKLLRGILVDKGHTVVTTRTTDTYVALSARTKTLNAAKCDIAISVHVNSSSKNTAQYISTWIVAQGGKAEILANYVQKQLVTATGWPDGGVRVGNFHMVRETKMPAVLLEIGFLSNPVEEEQLNDPAIQKKIAEAIAAGIEQFRLHKSGLAVNTEKKEGAIMRSEPWKEDIVRRAEELGIVSPDAHHEPEDVASKWFVLAVALNLLNIIKKEKE